MQHAVLGIDFGTTNSAVGRVCGPGDAVALIPVEQGACTIPTALFYTHDNQVLFGRAAISAYIDGTDGRFVRSVKRILGTDLMDKSTIVNTRAIRFDTIIKTFLSHLKQTAERACQCDISSVVIGRPVHFQDNGPELDQRAQNKVDTVAREIGFKNVCFQYEPVAAAFAHEQHLTQDKLAFIVDLGGGTADFSVIRIGPSYRSQTDRLHDILATYGIRVGGNDFDRDFCLSAFMPSFGKGGVYGTKRLSVPDSLYFNLAEWSLINFCYTFKNKMMVQDILAQPCDRVKIERLAELLEYQLAHHLLKVAEDAKVQLSTHEQETLIFRELSQNLIFAATRQEFNDAIQASLDKIRQAMMNTLALAGVSASQINMVILTGGTCLVPAVKLMIDRVFPGTDISESAKLESVCTGLTLTAQKLFYGQ